MTRPCPSPSSSAMAPERSRSATPARSSNPMIRADPSALYASGSAERAPVDSADLDGAARTGHCVSPSGANMARYAASANASATCSSPPAASVSAARGHCRNHEAVGPPWSGRQFEGAREACSRGPESDLAIPSPEAARLAGPGPATARPRAEPSATSASAWRARRSCGIGLVSRRPQALGRGRIVRRACRLALHRRRRVRRRSRPEQAWLRADLGFLGATGEPRRYRARIGFQRDQQGERPASRACACARSSSTAKFGQSALAETRPRPSSTSTGPPAPRRRLRGC